MIIANDGDSGRCEKAILNRYINTTTPTNKESSASSTISSIDTAIEHTAFDVDGRTVITSAYDSR